MAPKESEYGSNSLIVTLIILSSPVILRFPEYGSREVQLNFVTDQSVTRRGFYIEYVQELCPSTRSTGGHSYPPDNPSARSPKSEPMKPTDMRWRVITGR